jgi:hypothetical protein
MTQPATTQSRANPFRQELSPVQLAFGTALSGGAGAIAAGIFTTVSPLGGAVFGVSSFLSHWLIHWICDKINCCPESVVFKVAQFTLRVIGGIGAGVLTTTVVGFPMTMTTGVILTVALTGVIIATLLTLGSCLCSSAAASGLAFAAGDGRTSIRV